MVGGVACYPSPPSCVHLSLEDPCATITALLQGHEVEAAALVARLHLACPAAAAAAWRAVAARCEALGLHGPAVDCLRRCLAAAAGTEGDGPGWWRAQLEQAAVRRAGAAAPEEAEAVRI